MGLEGALWDVSSVAWGVVTLGLIGASVLGRLFDSDDDDGDGTGDGDGDVFGSGDGLGGEMGDDSFDDFDGMDEWDDEFGGDTDDGSGTDELEGRLDDLEAEVATLSSTVSTVRSENEEIAAAVEDTEEDVRNLLDIYEMVTRGINPFVDDAGGFGSEPAEGSFGLFDDDEPDETEALDDDVASADASGFFDEDLLDPADDADFADESSDDQDGVAADATTDIDPADEDDDMNDDGKSFSELKAEYDAGEADWAGDEPSLDDEDVAADDDAFEEDAFDQDGLEASDLDDPFDDDPTDEPPLEAESDELLDDSDPLNAEPSAEPDPLNAEPSGEPDPLDAEPSAEPDPLDAEPSHSPDPFDTEPSGDPAASTTEPSSREDAQQPADTRRSTGGRTPGGDPADFEYVDRDGLSERREKPYLTELPGDYVGDLLVMEWLEFLVSAGDVTDAVRAIHYYERIEWIGPDAASRLREFLSGFGTVDRNLVDQPGTDHLVRDHHTRSLRYITQLNGTDTHHVLLNRWDDLVGGSLVASGPVDEPTSRRDTTTEHARSNGASPSRQTNRSTRPDGGDGRGR